MQNRCDPHHRFGRSYRFSEQDLLDLDAQTAVPPTAGEVDQLAATRGRCGQPGPSPRSNAITTDLTTLMHGDLPMGHRSDPRWRTEPTERRGRIADPAPVCERRVFRVWPPSHVTRDCRELQASQCRAQPLD